jgi:DNA ligase-1
MKFNTVALSFDKIDALSSRTAMTEALALLLKEATPEEAAYICYLSLGALNPPHIGTQFNIAQKTMLKIVAHLYGLTGHQIKESVESLGDLGSVAQKYAPEETNDISLITIYNKLLEIEKIQGTGSQEKKSQTLQHLLQMIDPLSAKFIIRIIIGALRLGFSDMTIIDALSWMEVGDKSLRSVIEDAYNVCADIGLIARTLKADGLDAIKAMKMHVGVPIRPAAAERLPDVNAIMAKLGPCVAQHKLDGFRLQVHVDKTTEKPVIRFFSRNLTDMSQMFPEFVEACKKLPVKSFIADGEAMVYDQNTKLFLPFQETVKRRRKHGISQIVSELPLQLHLFDLLFIDGKNLLNVSHTERRNALKKVIEPLQDETLKIIDEKQIQTADQLEQYFIESIASGLEGLVIKKPEAPYQPGKRSANWVKLKYQASDKMLDTLDVVILGYYPGKGKRAQFGIGAFLAGIYNPRDEAFETVAKIGTGLSDEEWRNLKKRCDALQVPSQPKNVRCDKNLAPAVWIVPTLVCEVLADEVTLSPVHSAGKTDEKLGFALRFPRFVKYREDKSAHQATTLAELASIHKR